MARAGVALIARCDPAGRIGRALARMGVDVVALERADALLVYGGPILPPAVFGAPPLGAWNFHPSLLPRRRGAEPERRALLLDDRWGGVTVHRITESVDAGPMLLRRRFRIEDRETIAGYRRKALRAIVTMLPEVLRRIARGAPTRPQPPGPPDRFTWDEARVRFAWPVRRIVRRVRFARPPLCAHAEARGRLLMFCDARPAGGPRGRPGAVVAVRGGRVRVRCRDGVVSLRLCDRALGRPLAARDAARLVRPGDRLT